MFYIWCRIGWSLEYVACLLCPLCNLAMIAETVASDGVWKEDCGLWAGDRADSCRTLLWRSDRWHACITPPLCRLFRQTIAESPLLCGCVVFSMHPEGDVQTLLSVINDLGAYPSVWLSFSFYDRFPSVSVSLHPSLYRRFAPFWHHPRCHSSHTMKGVWWFNPRCRHNKIRAAVRPLSKAPGRLSPAWSNQL